MTARLSHAMHLALDAVAAGITPTAAAHAHGVSLNGLYRALRRDAPKCPTCGASVRRKVAEEAPP